jgi:hypothetical protein
MLLLPDADAEGRTAALYVKIMRLLLAIAT